MITTVKNVRQKHFAKHAKMHLQKKNTENKCEQIPGSVRCKDEYENSMMASI